MYVFREPFLMVADPDMIKEILIKEFPKFHDRKVNTVYLRWSDFPMAKRGFQIVSSSQGSLSNEDGDGKRKRHFKVELPVFATPSRLSQFI